MRPRIGKVPHWDKVTPSEQKKLDEKAKKWVIIKYIHTWYDAEKNYWSKWAYAPQEDTPNIRWQVEGHPNATILMEKLNERDARMWAKMMS
jgi:hypothetical protein